MTVSTQPAPPLSTPPLQDARQQRPLVRALYAAVAWAVVAHVVVAALRPLHDGGGDGGSGSGGGSSANLTALMAGERVRESHVVVVGGGALARAHDNRFLQAAHNERGAAPLCSLFLPPLTLTHSHILHARRHPCKPRPSFLPPCRRQDLVEPHGYPLEEHFVATSDGYVLRLFRIPHGADDGGGGGGSGSSGSGSAGSGADSGSGSNASGAAAAPPPPRPVVLLQHALMDSSAGWALLGPRRALAFRLADAGFDVWLANSRGNRYSRNHTRLDPDADAAAFWAFSWADMAERDAPATVDYALSVARARSLVFVGYSQGAAVGLAALAAKPGLAARVSLAVLIVPVVFTAHVRSAPFVLLARLGLDRAAAAAGFGEWAAHTPATAARAARVCGAVPRLCALYLTAICGANPNGNLEAEVLSRLMAHVPVGTSVQNMALWSQSIRRRSATEVRRYDFGADCARGRRCNRREYHGLAPGGGGGGASGGGSFGGSSSGGGVAAKEASEAAAALLPPAFNLSAVEAPVALFTGGRDALATPADVALLRRALAGAGSAGAGVIVADRVVEDYAHLDFEVGADAPERVYGDVVALARAAAAGRFERRGGGTAGGGAAAAA